MFKLFMTALVALLLPLNFAKADALSNVKSSGKLIFGLEAGYKPFEFLDENNKLVGYDIEGGSEIGKRLGGVTPTPKDTNWSTVIQSLYNGDFNLSLIHI